jgi:proteasomal ATPase-associated factor 1
VLSGGSDIQLRIWSAVEGYCAAICKGHTAGILGTGIIDRGRNIICTLLVTSCSRLLACSRDGTARLWDCSSQDTIAVFAKESAPLNDCFIVQNVNSLPTSREIDSKEVGTDGKLVLLACENGNVGIRVFFTYL